MNLWCVRRNAQPATPKPWLTVEELEGLRSNEARERGFFESSDEAKSRGWISQKNCKQWRDDVQTYHEIMNQLTDRLEICARDACELMPGPEGCRGTLMECEQSYMDGESP